jgi:excisionase family DNA binding protein
MHRYFVCPDCERYFGLEDAVLCSWCATPLESFGSLGQAQRRIRRLKVEDDVRTRLDAEREGAAGRPPGSVQAPPPAPVNPAAFSPTSLTYDEAAQRLGCCKTTVKKRVGRGELVKAMGPGKKSRVTIASVEAFEARQSGSRPRPPPRPPRAAAKGTPVTPQSIADVVAGIPRRKR